LKPYPKKNWLKLFRRCLPRNANSKKMFLKITGAFIAQLSKVFLFYSLKKEMV